MQNQRDISSISLIIYSTLMIFLAGAVITILCLSLLLFGIWWGIAAQGRAIKSIDNRVKAIEQTTVKIEAETKR